MNNTLWHRTVKQSPMLYSVFPPRVVFITPSVFIIDLLLSGYSAASS